MTMTRAIFSPADREQLHNRGLTEEVARAQITTFTQGIPFTALNRPCTVGDGIVALQPKDLDRLAAVYTEAALSGRAMKFVPASGVASRMFRLLLPFLEHSEPIDAHTTAEAAKHDILSRDLLQFIRALQQFAFYDELQAVMTRNGLNLARLLERGQFTTILEYLLTSRGLNYANLPKALLTFHRYPNHCRTPLEEHLVEAAAYVRGQDGRARLHFTVTLDHYDAVATHFKAVQKRYEQSGTHYDVTFSTQEPATDTIAVNLDNQPLRDQQGQLVFRPAGHGALLTNLQALAGDLVFIKNIDNIVPDHLKAETYVYKRALGGILVDVQKQMFIYLHQLAQPDIDDQYLDEIFTYARKTLSIVPPSDMPARSKPAKTAYLTAILNRPLRVCGMVPNAEEPGGGPFWVQHPDERFDGF